MDEKRLAEIKERCKKNNYPWTMGAMETDSLCEDKYGFVIQRKELGPQKINLENVAQDTKDIVELLEYIEELLIELCY